MRRVNFEKIQPGDLVQVPGTQYDSRQGLNGYLYREAVVLEKGRAKVSGHMVIRVRMEYPASGKNAYKTIERIFKASYVFQSNALTAVAKIFRRDNVKTLEEIPAYLEDDVVGSEWIRFLYDEGFITQTLLDGKNPKKKNKKTTAY